MDKIYEWIKQIVYFLLFVGMIRNLTGKDYEKYARFAVGLCLVLMLASPLMEILTNGNFESIWKKNEMEQELLGVLRILDNEDIPASSKSAWTDGVVREYEELILRQSQELLAELGVAVASVELWLEKAEAADKKNDSMVIGGFTIYVKLQEGAWQIKQPWQTEQPWQFEQNSDQTESETEKIKGIGEVSITDIIVSLEKEKEEDLDQNGGSVYEMAIKKRLADFYNMDGAHINVIIQ